MLGKRICCILMLVVLTVCMWGAGGTVVFALDESTTTNLTLSDAELLARFGIFRGYEDGLLHTEYNVTRMEYVALIMRCLKYDSEFMVEEQLFDDVPKDSWGAAYIKAALDLQIINGYGNGKFGPDDPVTVIDVIKILVSALGYGAIAQEKGGYPNGYLAVAMDKKIIDKIPQAGVLATREDVAEVIVNSLEINVMLKKVGMDAYFEGEDTILSIHKISKRTGTLIGLYGVSLDNSVSLRKNECLISGEVFLSDFQIPVSLLGQDVVMYIQDYDKSKKLLAVLPRYRNSSNSITVSSGDILPETTLLSFTYLENNEVKTEKLDPSLKVCYNGKMIESTAQLSDLRLKPQNGFVTLIDYNQDNMYDLAIVKDYRTYVVKSISEDAVYDLFGNNFKINDNHTDYIIIKDEVITELDEMKVNDVLSVAASIDNSIVEIIISEKKAEGVIDTIWSEDGKTWYGLDTGEKFSLTSEYIDAVEKGYSSAKRLEIGQKVSVLLNYFNEIAALHKNQDENDNQSLKYGFIVDAKLSGNKVSGMVVLRVLNSENKIINLAIEYGRKVHFGRTEDDMYCESSVEATDVYDYITKNNYIERQLIRYQATEDGRIRKIYFSDDKGENKNFARSAYLDSRNFAFHIIDNQYYWDDNTVVFHIPFNGDYEELLSSGKAEQYFRNNTYYTVELYDVDSNGHVGCIKYTEAVEKKLESGLEYWLDYLNSPVLLITDVYSTISDAGVTYTVLEGFENKKRVVRMLSDTLSSNRIARSELRPGAIIQYDTNAKWLRYAAAADDDEVVTVYSLLIDCNNTEQSPFVMWDYDTIRTSGRIHTSYGTVERYDYPIIRINGYAYEVHGGTTVYHYDTKKKSFTKIDAQHIAEGSTIFLRSRRNNLREIVVIE